MVGADAKDGIEMIECAGLIDHVAADNGVVKVNIMNRVVGPLEMQAAKIGHGHRQDAAIQKLEKGDKGAASTDKVGLKIVTGRV